MPDVTAELANRASTNLATYTKAAWPVIEPATPLIWNWHLDAICEHLEAVTAGDIRNLIITVPPGHMKSILVSVAWMTWEWIRFPYRRWMFASYASSLSIRDSVKCRRVIESDWYQSRWGNRFALTDDQNAKIKFENDQTGFRIATSVGGTATGERAHRLVVDDAHNVKERESETVRVATLDWYDNVWSNRQCDYQKDSRAIIQQRVHEKDLAGHLLARGGYEHLCLPTEFEPARKCVTSIGWEDPRKVEGELLFPQRFGPTEVAEAKVTLGSSGYSGQHQQSPNPAGGGRFKAKWFRYYKEVDGFYVLYRQDGSSKSVRVADCNRFATMDPAGTEKEQDNKACYTVVGVWDVTPDGDMLRVGHYREQVEAPAAADAAVGICRRFDVPWIGVEKDGIGLGVVQTIRRKGIPVRPIKARGSKEARSEVAEIRMEAGMIYMPQGAPWLFDWEKELLAFPNGEYKDQVDELAHAAMWVQKVKGAPGRDDDVAWTERKDEQAKGELAAEANENVIEDDAHPHGTRKLDPEQEARMAEYDAESMWT